MASENKAVTITARDLRISDLANDFLNQLYSESKEIDLIQLFEELDLFTSYCAVIMSSTVKDKKVYLTRLSEAYELTHEGRLTAFKKSVSNIIKDMEE